MNLDPGKGESQIATEPPKNRVFLWKTVLYKIHYLWKEERNLLKLINQQTKNSPIERLVEPCSPG